MKTLKTMLLTGVALLGSVLSWGDTVDCSTWADLKSNLEAGNSVRLTADLDVGETVAISSGTVTLDFNGHKIAYPSWNNANPAFFKVSGGAAMTVVGKGTCAAFVDTEYGSEYACGRFVELTGTGTSVTLDGDITYENFSDCHTSEGYSACYVASSASLTVNKGVFSGCKIYYASCGGAAIYSNGGAVTVNGGTFSDCGCQWSNGGAISCKGGTLTVNDGLFTGCKVGSNNSTAYGGAIYFNANKDNTSILRIKGGTFKDCLAVYGGAIYFNGDYYDDGYGSAYIYDGTFTNCTAVKGGGAIFFNNPSNFDNDYRNGHIYGGLFVGCQTTEKDYQYLTPDNRSVIAASGSHNYRVCGCVCDLNCYYDINGVMYSTDYIKTTSTEIESNYGPLYVIGRNGAAVGGILTGGTYTFDITDDRYVEAGVYNPEYVQATKDATSTPNTWTLGTPKPIVAVPTVKNASVSSVTVNGTGVSVAKFYVLEEGDDIVVTYAADTGCSFIGDNQAVLNDVRSNATIDASGVMALKAGVACSNWMDVKTNLEAGVSVKLMNDVTADATVNISKEEVLQLDLNGFTIKNAITSNSMLSVRYATLMLTGSGTIRGVDGTSTAGGQFVNASYSPTEVIVAGDITFENFATSGDGGVFYVFYATLTINNGTFKNCSASNGGVIYNYYYSNVIINDGTFESCSATNGGVINSYRAETATINGGTFNGCSATTSGGVIYGTATVNGGVFTGSSCGGKLDHENAVIYGSVTVNGAVSDWSLMDNWKASSKSADWVVNGNHYYRVIGENVAYVSGMLVGGTYTFDPRNDEYVAIGLSEPELALVEVTENTTVTPHTWTVTAPKLIVAIPTVRHATVSSVTVNGTSVAVGKFCAVEEGDDIAVTYAPDDGYVVYSSTPTAVLNDVSGSNATIDASGVKMLGIGVACSNWTDVKTNLEAGVSVKLVNDVTADAPVSIVDGALVALNLNGFTIKNTIESSSMLTVKGTTLMLTGSGIVRGIDGTSSIDGPFVKTDCSYVYSVGAVPAEVIVDGDITFENFATSGKGGVFYVYYSDLTINNGTFANCSAGNGGVIYNEYDGNVTINDGTFSECSATNGGVIYNYMPETATVNGGAFIDCSATKGGVIYNYYASMTVNGGTFDSCSATTSGGLIYNQGYSGTATVNGGVFTGSSCGGKSDISEAICNGAVTVNGAVSDRTLMDASMASGKSAAWVVNGNHYYRVIGENVAYVSGMLVGGTYTFDPRNDEYAAIGLSEPELALVEIAQDSTVTPNTWTVTAPKLIVAIPTVRHASVSSVTVNGTSVSAGKFCAVEEGDDIAVTYAPDDGYVVYSSTPTAVLNDVSGSNATIDASGVKMLGIGVACSNWTDVKTNLEAGVSVKLVNDVTADATVSITDGALMQFDLNGFTIQNAITTNSMLTVKGTTLMLTGSGIVRGIDGTSSVDGQFVKTDYGYDYSARVAVTSEVIVEGDITFENFATSGNGGVFNLYYGTLTINNGTFESCSAGNGGVAYGYYNGVVTVNGGTFSNCSATNGGVFYSQPTTTVNGGTFRDCSATYGGVIYNYYGTLTINGGMFDYCSATTSGGVVYGKFLTHDGDKQWINGGVFLKSMSNGSYTASDAIVGATTVVNGGVSDVSLLDSMKATGKSTVKVGSYYVTGENIAQLDGILVGGTYTFDPINDEYVDIGLCEPVVSVVTSDESGTPKTYSLTTTAIPVTIPKVPLATVAEITVNGTSVPLASAIGVQEGDTVVVTYAAAAGCTFPNGETATLANVTTGNRTVDVSEIYVLRSTDECSTWEEVCANLAAGLDVKLTADVTADQTANMCAGAMTFDLCGHTVYCGTHRNVLDVAINVGEESELTLTGDGVFAKRNPKQDDVYCVAINSEGGKVTIDGTGTTTFRDMYYVVYVSGEVSTTCDAVITNVVFDGCTRVFAHYSSETDVAVSAVGCTFKNCTCCELIATDGQVTVSDCAFTDCLSSDEYGLLDGATVSNCTFTGISGASVSHSHVTDCTFSNNTGCSCVHSTVRHCTFTSCSSGNYVRGENVPHGGAVTYGTVADCVFTGCSAQYGGAISAASAVSNCLISNCVATVSGGAIFCYPYGSLVVEDLIIDSCNANSYGGGIYSEMRNSNSGTVKVTNCVISRCNSGSGGGAIYTRDQAVVIHGGAFISNTVSGNTDHKNALFGGNVTVYGGISDDYRIQNWMKPLVSGTYGGKYKASDMRCPLIGGQYYLVGMGGNYGADIETNVENKVIYGKFSFNPGADIFVEAGIDILAENAPVIYNELYYRVVHPEALCSTWEEVKAKLEAGIGAKLMADITVPADSAAKATGTVWLDLNGHTLTLNGRAIETVEGTSGDDLGCNLTVWDTAGGAKVTQSESHPGNLRGGFAQINANSSVTVEGGTFENFAVTGDDGYGAIFDVLSSGYLRISGGTFKNCSASQSGSVANNAGSVSIYGGVFLDNTATNFNGNVTVYSAVFDSYDEAKRLHSYSAYIEDHNSPVVWMNTDDGKTLCVINSDWRNLHSEGNEDGDWSDLWRPGPLAVGWLTFCPTNAEYVAAGLKISKLSGLTHVPAEKKTDGGYEGVNMALRSSDEWILTVDYARVYVQNWSATKITSIKVDGVSVDWDWPILAKIGAYVVATYEAADGYVLTGSATASGTVESGNTYIGPVSAKWMHTHCCRGDYGCTTSSHGTAGIEWQMWTETGSLPTTAGYYYLVNDVTLTSEYVPVTGVYLCLNGKTIRQTGTNQRVIGVGEGVSFFVTDCDHTTEHKFTVGTDGLWTPDSASGTNIVKGGCIVGGTSTVGGGLQVQGTAALYNVNVVGNTAGTCGGIDLAGGTLTLLNATVTGNTSGSGAAVTAHEGTGINLLGTVVIDGNKAGGEPANLYLDTGVVAATSTGDPLTDDTRIGVGVPVGTAATIPVTGSNGSDITSYFTSETDGYLIVNGANNAVTMAKLIQVGDDAWAYILTNVCHVTVGTTDMWSYKAAGKSVLWGYRSEFDRVIVGNGVTGVGAYVFANMKALRSVEIGDGVTSVGASAFDKCLSVTDITVGKDMQSLGYLAFGRCHSLELLSFAEEVKNVDPTAFHITARITMDGNNNAIITTVPTLSIKGYTQVTKGKAELNDENWETVTDENRSLMRFFKVVYEKQ